MKPQLLMIGLTLIGVLGPFLVSPFIGVAIYYLFAVMRPQTLWQWTLPDFAWSWWVAMATILATVLQGMTRAQDFKTLDHVPPPKGRRVTGVHVALIAWAIWLFITFLMAQRPDVSQPVMTEYLKIAIMITISCVIMRTPEQAFRLLLVAGFALGYIAYDVNFMYLFQGGYLGIYHNGYSGLDNNGAGLMLAMGVPLCVAIWEASRKWWGWIFAAFVPVIVHAVLMTYSRGAMVSLIIASPLIFIRSRRRGWITIGLLAMVWLVPILAGPEIRARFFTIQRYEQDPSAQGRVTSWKVAFEIADDYPVFGVGPRNANLFTYSYGADMEGRTIHSQALQLMADTGYVGFGFYIVVLLTIALSLRKSRKRWKRDHSETGRKLYAVAAGVEGSLATFVVGTLFLSLESFELPYLLFLLTAQLPTLVTESTEPASKPVPARVPARHPLLTRPAPAVRLR